MNSLRASESGLQLVDQARRKKRWTKTAEIWCSKGFTSRSTLNRFWAKRPIRKDAFVSICDAVDVDWSHVAELTELGVESVESKETTQQSISGYSDERGDRQSHDSTESSACFSQRLSQHDYGDAPETDVFYGRDSELSTLKEWITVDRCRLLLLLGMGGIGKTTLAAKLARTVSTAFDFVIWRSLRNAPQLAELLTDIIQFLDPKGPTLPDSLDAQIRYLIQQLTSSRCLLILDNAESILESGDRTGRYRESYEGYEQLFRAIGDTPHQSCLMITTREQPKGLSAIEGERLPVRCCQLSGIQVADGQALLANKAQFIGSTDDWTAIIHHYAGNPLALKIVASAVRDFFSGNLSQFQEFIQHSPCLFDDIDDLLTEQIERLTSLEQTIMYWLAINRE
ncbi:MAG: NB-ARC domain-containing protein, partial [Cyanobacteria bacterium J06626_14]